MRVKTLMASPAPTIQEDAGLRGARGLMRPGGVPDLLVVRASRLVGLVRHRDLRRVSPSVVPSLAPYELPWLLDEIKVRDVMTRHMAVVAPDTSVEEAARLARWRRAQSLPVLEEGELVGVVTRRHLLGALVELLEAQAPTTVGHLLVPTDFGRAAARAVRAGTELAHRQRARLTLLHVLPRTMRVALLEGLPPDAPGHLREDRRRECFARLGALVPPGGEAGDVACRVAVGDPAAQIVKVAARFEADLIVMGAGPRRGLTRLLGGSVADGVIRRAPCPVLAIKG